MAKKKREIKKTSFDELPEPIIQHILSFLLEKDAIKTSILSKAWLSAWRTKPNLEFNSFEFFEKDSKISKMGSSEEKKKERKEFSKYIKRTLKRYTQQKISIETLNLDLIDLSGAYSMVDSLVKRCTRVAVERGVKNLHLSANSELPPFVVGAKSLVELSLGDLNMLHLSTEKITWDSLERLCLFYVSFDEVMFEKIISSCPLLEDLEIYYCIDNTVDYDEFDNQLQFKLMEHHNLKELTVGLYENQRLILGEAPKLESLVCTIHEDYLEDGGDLIPCGFTLHSSQYQNLEMLDLCAVSITDDFFNNFEQKFPNLRDLLVQYCQVLRRIKISSQTLERIKLLENYELEEVHFDVPSIEFLEYMCDKCEIIPEFSFSTPAKGKTHWISKLRIVWWENVDGYWFLQLKKLLGNLIPSEIFLDIAIDGRIKFDKNYICNSLIFGEPQELQELSLDICKSSSILSALDGFFSICRPNSVSQSWENCLHKDDPLVVKLFYDMIMFRTNVQYEDHHKLQQQLKCWQHDLRQAKVEIYCREMLIVGNATAYVKGEVDGYAKTLDWESILKALSRPWATTRIIHYTLEWEKQNI